MRRYLVSENVDNSGRPLIFSTLIVLRNISHGILVTTRNISNMATEY